MTDSESKWIDGSALRSASRGRRVLDSGPEPPFFLCGDPSRVDWGVAPGEKAAEESGGVRERERAFEHTVLI